jgi:hypothetical protein
VILVVHTNVGNQVAIFYSLLSPNQDVARALMTGTAGDDFIHYQMKICEIDERRTATYEGASRHPLAAGSCIMLPPPPRYHMLNPCLILIAHEMIDTVYSYVASSSPMHDRRQAT